jgi:hypothetical protein
METTHYPRRFKECIPVECADNLQVPRLRECVPEEVDDPHPKIEGDLCRAVVGA